MEKRYGRLADEGERILVEDETTIYEVDVRCMECQKEKGHRFLKEEIRKTSNKHPAAR